jgi:hypothetical protein
MLRPCNIVSRNPKAAIPIERTGGRGSTNTAAMVMSRPTYAIGEFRSTRLVVMDASLKDVHRPEDGRA